MPLRSLIIVLIAMAVVPLTVIGLSWNPFALGAAVIVTLCAVLVTAQLGLLTARKAANVRQGKVALQTGC